MTTVPGNGSINHQPGGNLKNNAFKLLQNGNICCFLITDAVSPRQMLLPKVVAAASPQ